MLSLDLQPYKHATIIFGYQRAHSACRKVALYGSISGHWRPRFYGQNLVSIEVLQYKFLFNPVAYTAMESAYIYLT